MEQLWHKTGIPLADLLVSFCYYYYSSVFLMFLTNLIMAQDQDNYVHNTKGDWWVLFLGTLCHLIEQLQSLMGNSLEFFLVSLYYNNLMPSYSWKIITMFRVEIPSPQHIFLYFVGFSVFLLPLIFFLIYIYNDIMT